jgi:hypothetical protein
MDFMEVQMLSQKSRCRRPVFLSDTLGWSTFSCIFQMQTQAFLASHTFSPLSKPQWGIIFISSLHSDTLLALLPQLNTPVITWTTLGLPR